MKGIFSRRAFDPGTLRQLLIFTRGTNPRSLSGGFGDTQEVVFRVRGKLEALQIQSYRGEQFAITDWVTSRAGYKATIRWRDDVTPDMQIVVGVRIFKIRECPQVERSENYMEILCEEVLA
jgi:SPP1 family predicted phage head-tail adaptor